MGVFTLDPILLQRFIDGIDNRIYRIDGIKINCYLSNGNLDDIQKITLDFYDKNNGILICRLEIGNNNIAYRIIKINIAFDIPCEYIIIDESYTSATISDRIFQEVQNHILEYFKNKEDGE